MISVRKRAIDGFQGGYLSLISIVQGTVLAFLITTVLDIPAMEDKPGFNGISLIQWCLFGMTMFTIVLTWHEYWIGTTAMPFVISLFDSAYPFALGTIEFLLVKSIMWWDKEPQAWFLIMGIF